MLLKSRISKIAIHSDEWFQGRAGKFTSSEIHHLMGENPYTVGAETYINRKVGEKLTGVPAKDDFEVDAMRWGAVNEPLAIRKFAQIKELEYVVCQQLITDPNSQFGSTPDGLIVHRESADGLSYDVSTIEVKCPPTYHNYIKLALCKTPQDVKSASKPYYWQVLDQMQNCDALIGYFVVFHPEFKQGNINIVEFRKMQATSGKDKYPLVTDLKLLELRKQMAVERFKITEEQLTMLQTV